MANFCGIHPPEQGIIKDCPACNMPVNGSFLEPMYDRLNQLKKMGYYQCTCGFVFHKLITYCALCNKRNNTSH